MNNKICVLPFHHLDISVTGKILPCCQFDPNVVPENINVYNPNVFHSEFFKQIRNDMINDRHVTGCERCYTAETHSSNSFRIEMLKRFKDDLGVEFTPPDQPKLVFVNLAFSNLCNNKCRMCNSKLSTSWYNDAKNLGMTIPKGAVVQTYSLDNLNFHDLKAVNIAGGEPLMEQDKIKELLGKCDLKKLTVVITTNSTLLPDEELLELLKKCKTVQWNLSIDAYGTLNDFLRKGSDWNTIEKNLLWYNQHFDFIKINTVISIYNVNHFNVLADYIRSNYPKIDHRHLMITGVDWMQIYNLPIHVKDLVRKRVQDIKNNNSIPICDYILGVLDRNGDFDLFLSMDSKLNTLRQEHWQDHNQELYEWINNKEQIC